MRGLNIVEHNERVRRVVELKGRLGEGAVRILSRIVSEVFGVSECDILSVGRGRRVVSDARMCLMWHLRSDACMGWSEIGSYCHHSHASVIHAVREYEEIVSLGVDKGLIGSFERVSLALGFDVNYSNAVGRYREACKITI